MAYSDRLERQEKLRQSAKGCPGKQENPQKPPDTTKSKQALLHSVCMQVHAAAHLSDLTTVVLSVQDMRILVH